MDNEAIKQIYAKAQNDFFVDNVALAIANREPGEALNVQGGRKYHRPIIGFAEMQSYTPYTATAVDTRATAEDEFLLLDGMTHAESVKVDIDDVYKAQLTDQDLVSRYGTILANTMKDSVEKRWVSNIVGAHKIGATLPVNFTSGTGNTVLSTTEDALAMVDSSDGSGLSRVFLVGPREYRAIEALAGTRNTTLGDEVWVNGIRGRRYFDTTLVKSNNLPWSGTIELPQAVTANDTITVGTTVFTFKAALTAPAVPGEVLIGANIAASRANLANAIVGGVGAGTTYTPVKTTDRMYLSRNRRVTATVNGNNVLLTGFGDIKLDDTLTHTDNKVSDRKKKIFLTAIGAVDLGLQLDGGIEMSRPKPASGELHVTRLSGLILHNSKTFTDGTLVTTEITVDASGY